MPDPKQFPGQNHIIAKDQPQYRPLPAFVDANDPQGRMVFCWQFSPQERAEIARTGVVWQQVLTFDSKLQPQNLSVTPFGMTPTDGPIALPLIPVEDGQGVQVDEPAFSREHAVVIRSLGEPCNTTVELLKTGQRVPGVSGIDVRIRTGEIITASLEMVEPFIPQVHAMADLRLFAVEVLAHLPKKDFEGVLGYVTVRRSDVTKAAKDAMSPLPSRTEDYTFRDMLEAALKAGELPTDLDGYVDYLVGLHRQIAFPPKPEPAWAPQSAPPPVNPWADSTWNLTRQGEMMRLDPQKALELMQMAGKAARRYIGCVATDQKGQEFIFQGNRTLDGQPAEWRDYEPGRRELHSLDGTVPPEKRLLAVVWKDETIRGWRLETFGLLAMRGYEPTIEAAMAGAERAFQAHDAAKQITAAVRDEAPRNLEDIHREITRVDPPTGSQPTDPNVIPEGTKVEWNETRHPYAKKTGTVVRNDMALNTHTRVRLGPSHFESVRTTSLRVVKPAADIDDQVPGTGKFADDEPADGARADDHDGLDHSDDHIQPDDLDNQPGR